MAKLRTICIDNTCMDNTEYGAHQWIKLNQYNRFYLPISIQSGNVTPTALTSGTAKDTLVYTASANGILNLSIRVDFPTNTTGMRYLSVLKRTSSSGSWFKWGDGFQVGASPYGYTTLSASGQYYVEKDSQFGFRLIQTSGSSLTPVGITWQAWFIEE